MEAEEPQSQEGRRPSAELMHAMMEWMFMDGGVAARMEQFAQFHCDHFDYIADRDDFERAENKLVYTEIYTLFQQQFEAEIEQWLTSQGWTMENFLWACQEEDARQREGVSFDNLSWECTWQFIVAISEYSTFKSMMLDEKKKKLEALRGAPVC